MPLDAASPGWADAAPHSRHILCPLPRTLWGAGNGNNSTRVGSEYTCTFERAGGGTLEGSKSLINLGELGKPANTLVEKISDAIGGIARPWQIVRVAQAEAEAEKIRAVTQIEITELQRRAMVRFLAEEAKRQNNIEGITAKALPEVSPEAKPESMEDDWIANFFDKCRLISDEEMQSLWARILAEEANAPGRFSKRTVDLVGTLDKSDALLFAQLCGFAVSLGEMSPLIYEPGDEIYTKQGINFESLSHLESLGLIRFSELAGYVRTGFGRGATYRTFGPESGSNFPNLRTTRCRLERSF